MKQNQIRFLNKFAQSSIQRKKLFKHEYSKSLIPLLELLYKEGLILSYNFLKNFVFVYIREKDGVTSVKNIKILATPSKKYYISYRDLVRLSFKNKNLFLSTSKGLLSLLECKKHRVGGVLLFSC